MYDTSSYTDRENVLKMCKYAGREPFKFSNMYAKLVSQARKRNPFSFNLR